VEPRNREWGKMPSRIITRSFSVSLRIIETQNCENLTQKWRKRKKSLEKAQRVLTAFCRNGLADAQAFVPHGFEAPPTITE